MTFVRKIHPWKAIYKSWYDPDIYREAVHCWRGLGYRFLLFELLGLWIVASVHVQIVVVSYVNDYLMPLVQAMPKMEIKNGSLTIDRPEDFYQVKDQRSGKAIITFDLSQEPRLPPLQEDGIFLHRNQAILHWLGKEQLYDFDEMKDNTLMDWELPARMLNAIAFWSGIVVLAIFWISSFVLCALQVLVYGLAGRIVTVFIKRRLTYAQLVRISVLALTPSLIIDTCQKLLCLGIPAWSLVSVLITLAYLVFGVKVNSVAFEWSLSQGVAQQPFVKDSSS